MRRGSPKRIWDDAESKREPCRGCGAARVHLHHVIGRSMDRKMNGVRYVAPESVISLCMDCHEQAHEKRLDVWALMTETERSWASNRMGSESLAQRRAGGA